MKKFKIFILVLLIISLIGCGNNISEKAVEEGKIALASKEYEKAEGLFKLAYNEDENNKDAKNLYELVEGYLLLIEAINNNVYDEIEKYLSELENNDNISMIESEINSIKSEIEDINKYKEKIKEIEDLLNNKSFSEAKTLSEQLLENIDNKNTTKVVEGLLQQANDNLVKLQADEQRKIEIYKERIKELSNTSSDLNYKDIYYFEDKEGMPEELIGRTTYMFKEIIEFSPRIFFYDEIKDDVFYAAQGRIIWANNGNRDLIQEIEDEKGSIKITIEEAQNLVNTYVIPLLSENEQKNPRVIEGHFTKGSEMIINNLPENEKNNNFYSVMVVDDRKTETKYVVNAYNGNLYKILTGEKIN